MQICRTPTFIMAQVVLFFLKMLIILILTNFIIFQSKRGPSLRKVPYLSTVQSFIRISCPSTPTLQVQNFGRDVPLLGYSAEFAGAEKRKMYIHKTEGCSAADVKKVSKLFSPNNSEDF